MEAAQTIAHQRGGIAVALRTWVDRLIDLEFTNPIAFAALTIAYFGSRVYWLNLGYGTDPDAWRVALTAQHLWDTGDYYPSRLPGYPLHELATAAAVQWGWVWTNFSTVCISVVGVYLFAWLARKLELPNRGALTLGFAFTPLLWINSMATMDYMWALTFVLGAYLALIYRAPTLAGLLLGIAAGFRLTSLLMLPPFWLLLWRSGQRHDLRPVTTTSLAVTLVCYTLVLMNYGINFLNFFDQDVPVEEFVKRLGKDGLGIIGGLAVLGAIAVSLPRLRRLPGDLRNDAHILTWVAAILIFFLSYTRLPHEIAYLIPLFPFGFFLMARYVNRAVLVAVLVIIVIAGFVDVTTPEDTIGIDSSTFTSARLGKGMILSNEETLRNQAEFAHELRRITIGNYGQQTPMVVATGFIYPELVMLYKDELNIGILEKDHTAISQLSDKGMAADKTRNIEYVWLLSYDDFNRMHAEGKHVYFTADAARSTYAVYGFRPGYIGAQELPLSRQNPSLGEGAAQTDR